MAKKYTNDAGQSEATGASSLRERLPQGEFHHDLAETEVDRIIQETFCPVGRHGAYKDLKRYSEATKEGMTRICYLAKWGMTEAQPGVGVAPKSYRADVIIKVDKPLNKIDGENSRRNMLKGYDTSNDIAALIGARHNNLARLIDFKMIPLKNGETLYVSVEQYVPGVSLQRRVENKPLSGEEFETVFKKTIAGLSYMINKLGRYHRDLKPSNIILGEGSGAVDEAAATASDLELLVTDFSNSCLVEDAHARRARLVDTTDPTSGAHLVMNPFLFGKFARNPTRYDARSEIFSLGATMYFALTGKYLFECNRLGHTAIANVGGQQVDLLDEGGKIDVARYREAVDAGLRENQIKGRYANAIRKCLLAPLCEEHERKSVKFIRSLFSLGHRGYHTIDDLAEDFDSLTDVLSRKLKKTIYQTAFMVGTTAASALLIFSAGYVRKVENQNIQLKNENSRIEQKLQAERNAKLQAEVRVEEFKREKQKLDVFLYQISQDFAQRGEIQLRRIELLTSSLDAVRKAYLADIEGIYNSDMPEDSKKISIENMRLLKEQADGLGTLLNKKKEDIQSELKFLKPEEQP